MAVALAARLALGLAALLAASAEGADVAATSALTFDVAGAKNRPVTKVITLL
eukprot:CAMPEP_0168389334 /NCGR_PEP_ID=MMETSP0228-20121227/16911_1 /TAXON_ID=133427 /ORGANISM="Protoceratium reticulatum, Strain CCCM 535 (=CCMP 1889)" /LENGTH=51 /DNA_ID=CAMNT_0008402605 /DNA_START=56 /DNA_END=208 /DNA_ORIENTATION=-